MYVKSVLRLQPCNALTVGENPIPQQGAVLKGAATDGLSASSEADRRAANKQQELGREPTGRETGKQENMSGNRVLL